MTWMEITPAGKLVREQSRFDKVKRMMAETAKKLQRDVKKDGSPQKQKSIGNHSSLVHTNQYYCCHHSNAS